VVITLRALSGGCGTDERGLPIKDAFLTFLIVSVAYIVTFSLTFGFVFPLQQLLFSGISTQVGLLFLPHGVRVLTLYFYGWRGMFYLLPVSYLMILLSVEQTGQDLLAPVVSLVCCYFGIQAIRLVFSDTISVSLKPQDWKLMVLGGVAASIFNALGLALLDHGQGSVAPNSTRFFEVLGYVTGDVLGLVICLLFMVYFFRMIRYFKPMSND
jgi:hypothetical protein